MELRDSFEQILRHINTWLCTVITMSARPLSTSVGRLSSHVLSNAGPRASRRFAAVTLPQTRAPSVAPQTRPFTCSVPSRNSNPSDNGNEEAKSRQAPAEKSTTEPAEETPDEPWYLQVEPPSQPPVHEPAPLPAIPAGSPAVLEPVLKYVNEEMGLDDLELLDLRSFDPPPALGPNVIMLFGTARSERHLHVASGRLVRWLRYNYKVEANADGLIGAGELKTKLRRLRRKAKLLGSSNIATQGGDDGITTGWICVNLGIVGGEGAEEARFDESGQMSGFGSTVMETGSTIVVQVMTEARRAELDLETLWKDSLERNQRQNQTFSSAPSRQDREMQQDWEKHVSRPAGARRPLAGYNQRRSYSTERMVSSEPAIPEHEAESLLHLAQRGILQLQMAPRDKECSEDLRDRHLNLLNMIFSPSLNESHAPQQLALTDDLLRLLSQRSPNVISNDVIVALVEAIANSGSKSPLLERAQANVESLMAIKQLPCLDDAQMINMLRTYGAQGNWDRFWDVWRMAPRFQRARSEELYAEVFEAAAASGDVHVCRDALRRCVPSMEFERPRVLPEDRVYEAVLQCVAVADPSAIATADKVAAGEASWQLMNYLGPSSPHKEERARQLFERQRDREFVVMVHELRDTRDMMAAEKGQIHEDGLEI